MNIIFAIATVLLMSSNSWSMDPPAEEEDERGLWQAWQAWRAWTDDVDEYIASLPPDDLVWTIQRKEPQRRYAELKFILSQHEKEVCISPELNNDLHAPLLAHLFANNPHLEKIEVNAANSSVIYPDGYHMGLSGGKVILESLKNNKHLKSLFLSIRERPDLILGQEEDANVIIESNKLRDEFIQVFIELLVENKFLKNITLSDLYLEEKSAAILLDTIKSRKSNIHSFHCAMPYDMRVELQKYLDKKRDLREKTIHLFVFLVGEYRYGEGRIYVEKDLLKMILLDLMICHLKGLPKNPFTLTPPPFPLRKYR